MSPISKDPILTYRRIRRAIGYLGMALPIVLVAGSLVPKYVQIQPSISHYYYTHLRDIFTGTLCAVGLFLIRYKGFPHSTWWKNDGLLTNIAGGAAFGVALLPTDPDCNFGHGKILTLIPIDAGVMGVLHYVSAAVLFLIFAHLSIFIFTIGQNRSPGVRDSVLDENNIYRTAGIAILCFIVLIPVSGKLFPHYQYSTLILEAFSLFAFGISWLIKVRALGDKGRVGEMLYGEGKGKQIDSNAGAE
jgi:hypothetical protein